MITSEFTSSSISFSWNHSITSIRVWDRERSNGPIQYAILFNPGIHFLAGVPHAIFAVRFIPPSFRNGPVPIPTPTLVDLMMHFLYLAFFIAVQAGVTLAIRQELLDGLETWHLQPGPDERPFLLTHRCLSSLDHSRRILTREQSLNGEAYLLLAHAVL